MHDLEQLRRRLWLAVIVGTAGCDSGDAKPAEAAKVVAEHVGDVKPDTEAKPVTKAADDSGGMQAVVDAALVDAAAKAEAKRTIAEAEKVALATSTCSVVVDRLTVTLGTEDTGTLEHGCPRYALGLGLEVEATGRLRTAGDDTRCCYEEYARPVRGRPYAVDGAPRLPGFTVRRTADPLAVQNTGRRRVAAGWLHDARDELASVAAFERAALELAQLGAPRHLIDACAVAAAQEHRHAALCLRIAEAFAARSLHLGPPLAVEPRRIGLLELLLETFEDGCAGEAIAAAIASRSARSASDEIRPALVEIAADEAEHAALAWSTLAWGLPRLTAPERATFFASAAARRIEPPKASHCDRACVDVDPAHGRMTSALQTEVAAEVWTRVIAPLLADLQHERFDARPFRGYSPDIAMRYCSDSDLSSPIA